MNKLIVSVFGSEKSAFEGLNAMRELHSEGSISLYSSAVLAKDESGEVHIRQAAEKGPYGTATGLAVGGLVGLLAGPVGIAAGAAASAVATAAMGGAVLGASFGGLTGMLVDLDDAGVDAGFVEEVSEALSPGKVAVVAEVEEYWMTPVDTRIEAEGGIVFRRLRSEVAEEQYQREARAFNEEWNQLKAEWQEASDDAKATIEKKMDANKAKMQAIQERTRTKMNQYRAESNAKIAVLKQQREEAKEEKKAKIDAKIEEVKADFHRRNQKLQEAWGLTKEALGPELDKAA
jgi:uncharacterized membrane protein